jgi:hypothetical protein
MTLQTVSLLAVLSAVNASAHSQAARRANHKPILDFEEDT